MTAKSYADNVEIRLVSIQLLDNGSMFGLRHSDESLIRYGQAPPYERNRRTSDTRIQAYVIFSRLKVKYYTKKWQSITWPLYLEIIYLFYFIISLFYFLLRLRDS